MRSSEAPTSTYAADSWQEEVARSLLRSGFTPEDTIGQVRHPANSQAGRTLGSVWRAMRNFVEGEPEGEAEKSRDAGRIEAPL